MFSRISKIENLSIKTLIFSSTLQIGDSSCIESYADVFAVQRQVPVYLGKEAEVLPYRIFSSPAVFLPIVEPVTTFFINSQPFIDVRSINIIGVSASSVVSAGNTGHAYMQSRVKHIRQLLNGRRAIKNGPDSTSIQTNGSQPS
ncbi:spore germination protein GerPE [Peribacillus glennii]|uniref:Spore germination protein GerPE n=1 Tax=Peribacillus glennii TaxID=2303991 RepID=A0A372LAA6_9BACI|nr:spore germination protein GerPE [Peribacillus glennii]RFU62149.1 spore germination protein GerPE [Peribacillus glennii]